MTKFARIAVVTAWVVCTATPALAWDTKEIDDPMTDEVSAFASQVQGNILIGLQCWKQDKPLTLVFSSSTPFDEAADNEPVLAKFRIGKTEPFLVEMKRENLSGTLIYRGAITDNGTRIDLVKDLLAGPSSLAFAVDGLVVAVPTTSISHATQMLQAICGAGMPTFAD